MKRINTRIPLYRLCLLTMSLSLILFACTPAQQDMTTLDKTALPLQTPENLTDRQPTGSSPTTEKTLSQASPTPVEILPTPTEILSNRNAENIIDSEGFVPACGTFSPFDEATSNPGVAKTFYHGSISANFSSPYLIGCTPLKLTANNADQTQSFEYNDRGLVLKGSWDAGTNHLNHIVSYTSSGLINAATYDCSHNNGKESFSFNYDAQAQLQSERRIRPANCYGDDQPALDTRINYFYEDPVFPALPNKKSYYDAYTANTITSEIQYSQDEQGRLTEIKEIFSNQSQNLTHFTYGENNQIVQKVNTPQEGLANTFYYSYDDEGRLLEIKQENTERNWQMRYGEKGALGKLITPNPSTNPINLEYRIAYQDSPQTGAALVAEPGSESLRNSGLADISNIRVFDHGAAPGSRDIVFDLSWYNSWRSSKPESWDAIWLFAKYRTSEEDKWQHAQLSSKPLHYIVTHENGIPATFSPAADGRGAFLYREKDGRGTIHWQDVSIPWIIDQNLETSDIEVQIFAVEMVYVPSGSFYLGDGQSPGSFVNGSNPSEPFLLSDMPLTLGKNENMLWANAQQFNAADDSPLPPVWDFDEGQQVPAEFPTGLDGFYMMKYEVSQGLYSAFLNTLTQQQASVHYPTQEELSAFPNCTQESEQPCRYTIAYDPAGFYYSAAPSRANNWMNWEDAAAFADWAGMRPMSELEYEKAARGDSSQDFVPAAYAWGSTKIENIIDFAGTDGSGKETPLPYYANTIYNFSIPGPVRVGIHEGKDSRQQTGAGYYGAFDLSGNVAEMVVTLAGSASLTFDGTHGDGNLTEDGFTDQQNWLQKKQADQYNGFGLRGGSFNSPAEDLQISSRNQASFSNATRHPEQGFRAVISVP